MSTHDRLCDNYKGTCCPWMGDCECQCMCEYIREIRDDEDRQILEDLHELKKKNRKTLLTVLSRKNTHRAEGFSRATNLISDILVRGRIEIRNAQGHH